MHRARAGLLICLAIALLAAPAADAADTTTSQRRSPTATATTASSRRRARTMSCATDLAAAPLRPASRPADERLFFGQMTDTHVVDEESPLRVEFLDKVGPPFTSAYRPQESLSAQVLDSMVEPDAQHARAPSRTTGSTS